MWNEKSICYRFLDRCFHGSLLVVISFIPGVPLAVGQPIEHPRRRLPANFAVSPEVTHRVSGLLKFAKDLSDQGLPAFCGGPGFSFLTRDVHPEFQLFRHPQFHMFALVPAIESLFKLVFYGSVARGTRPPYRNNSLESGSTRLRENFPFSRLRPIPGYSSHDKTSKNNAVKYHERYANLRST
jgi:hypothetical protein